MCCCTIAMITPNCLKRYCGGQGGQGGVRVGLWEDGRSLANIGVR